MGWDSENSSNLINLEFSCFEELRLLRRDADGRVFHAFFQHSDLIGIAAAAEGRLPALPHTLWVFDCAGMFQHAARSGTVGEELCTVLLTGDRHADGVLRHSDGTVTDQPVKAQAGDMQHIRGVKRHGEVLILDGFIRPSVIGVVQPPALVSVHRHLVWHKRVQSHDLILTVADDLRIGVAPEEQVRHEGFAEHEGTHLRVRLIVE